MRERGLPSPTDAATHALPRRWRHRLARRAGSFRGPTGGGGGGCRAPQEREHGVATVRRLDGDLLGRRARSLPRTPDGRRRALARGRLRSGGGGMVVRKSDYRVSQRFPFMTPNLLWRCMAVAGVFVFAVCLLCPPNRHTGGSQLNAAMTLFQSVLLWKAPTHFDHSAKRALCASCFLGYAVSAGVILGDILVNPSPTVLLLWSASFFMFFLAAQACAVYHTLDDQVTNKRPATLRVGILTDDFHFEDLGEGEREGPHPVAVVLKCFCRTALVTLLALCAALGGKWIQRGVASALA